MKPHGNKGKKKSPEHRAKLLKSLIPFQKGFDSRRQDGSKTPRGDKSPMWKGGIAYDPYTYEWTDTLRESMRQRDNYVCQMCGIYQDELSCGRVKKLDIHHINYDKDNCSPSNLISLCRPCHMKTNSNREFWLKYFI